MTKPAMMHFISEIPDPAAYGANDLTRRAEVKAKIIFPHISTYIEQISGTPPYSLRKESKESN